MSGLSLEPTDLSQSYPNPLRTHPLFICTGYSSSIGFPGAKAPHQPRSQVFSQDDRDCPLPHPRYDRGTCHLRPESAAGGCGPAQGWKRERQPEAHIPAGVAKVRTRVAGRCHLTGNRSAASGRLSPSHPTSGRRQPGVGKTSAAQSVWGATQNKQQQVSRCGGHQLPDIMIFLCCVPFPSFFASHWHRGRAIKVAEATANKQAFGEGYGGRRKQPAQSGLQVQHELWHGPTCTKTPRPQRFFFFFFFFPAPFSVCRAGLLYTGGPRLCLRGMLRGAPGTGAVALRWRGPGEALIVGVC